MTQEQKLNESENIINNLSDDEMVDLNNEYQGCVNGDNYIYSMDDFDEIMDGKVDATILAAFLAALKMKGETVDEVVGAASAMRKKAAFVNAGARPPIDTCGTGGDGMNTFNISTTSAFIVSGAGVPVAKHGNRAATSKCGSGDVLAALGFNLDVHPEVMEHCLQEHGIAFLFAPKMHPAMRFAAPVRKRQAVNFQHFSAVKRIAVAHSANTVADYEVWFAPIDESVLFFEHNAFGRLFFVLLFGDYFTGNIVGKRFCQQLRSHGCRFFKKLVRIHIVRNIEFRFGEHSARVHTYVGAHNSYAGLFFSVYERPLQRTASSVFRKQRSVHVQHAVFGNIDDFLR